MDRAVEFDKRENEMFLNDCQTRSCYRKNIKLSMMVSKRTTGNSAITQNWYQCNNIELVTVQ